MSRNPNKPFDALDSGIDLAFLLNAIPGLVSYVDTNQRYRFNNAAYEEWFGQSPNELRGRHMLDVLGPAAYAAVRPHIEAALEGRRVDFETVAAYEKGGVRDIQASYIPHLGADGRVCGFVAIVQDISEKKRAARDLSAAGARLTFAAEAAGLGEWRVDQRSGDMDLSDRAASILGLTPGRHPRGTVMDLIHPDDQQPLNERVNEAIGRGTEFDVEYRVLRADGSQRWVSARGRAAYEDSGAVTGVTGVLQDITAAKAAEATLREPSEALATINEIGQMLSAELDLQRLVQALTDAATELTGARFGAFFYNVLDRRGGTYMLYTLSGVSRDHFASFPMPRATKLFGPTFRGEGVLRIGDVRSDPRFGQNPPYHGMPRHHLPVVSYLAVPVVSRQGDVLGGLFFGHPDAHVFSERHERIVVGLAGQAAIAMDNARLFEAAENSRHAAETANRLKDEFLATVSHELRTPLNAIMGWARMLRGGSLDETHRARAIETIERNAVVQQRIIEDILDVSRIITGKLRLDVALMDLVTPVHAAIEAVRPSAVAKGVALSAHVEPDIGHIVGDASRIQQIVWNLASNAIKFTPRGGSVTVTLRQVDRFAEIAVADTGRGIPPAFLAHVFDRFRQGDASTTRTHGGLGLGLAIVRHLTELHGGSVGVESEGEGRGSVFTIRLPLGSELPAADEDEVPRTPSVTRADRLDADLAGSRVLVVDDEADARDLMRVVLSQCGADVRTAASAREALHLVETWKPTVVVCDIAMPSEDGYAFIRQLRERPGEQGGDTPAAALTAYARAEDRQQALAAGYQLHMAKPVDPSELAEAVAALASGRRP